MQPRGPSGHGRIAAAKIKCRDRHLDAERAGGVPIAEWTGKRPASHERTKRSRGRPRSRRSPPAVPLGGPSPAACRPPAPPQTRGAIPRGSGVSASSCGHDRDDHVRRKEQEPRPSTIHACAATRPAHVMAVPRVAGATARSSDSEGRDRDEHQEQRVELHALAGQQTEVREARVRDDEQQRCRRGRTPRTAALRSERIAAHIQRIRTRQSEQQRGPLDGREERLEVVCLEDEGPEQHGDAGKGRARGESTTEGRTRCRPPTSGSPHRSASSRPLGWCRSRTSAGTIGPARRGPPRRPPRRRSMPPSRSGASSRSSAPALAGDDRGGERDRDQRRDMRAHHARAATGPRRR